MLHLNSLLVFSFYLQHDFLPFYVGNEIIVDVGIRVAVVAITVEFLEDLLVRVNLVLEVLLEPVENLHFGLFDVALLNDSEKLVVNELVGEPDPQAHVKYCPERELRNQGVVHVLTLVSVPQCPNHDGRSRERMESSVGSKYGSEEEGSAKHYRYNLDELV